MTDNTAAIIVHLLRCILCRGFGGRDGLRGGCVAAFSRRWPLPE